MYVYVCSSVEERLCRTLELKITNQSINQSNRKQFVIHRIVSLAIINLLFPMLNTIWLKRTT